MNLGALPKNILYNEIKRSHNIITTCIGEEPKGFIAPAWSSSKNMMDILIELNYLYDTPLFPSIMLYPMLIKIALNHMKNPKKILRVINRKDWMFPFLYSRKQFIYHTNKNCSKQLLVMPMPCLSIFSLPYWHTLYFILGTQQTKKLPKKIAIYI